MSVSYQELNLDELGFLGRGKSKHRPRNDPVLYGGDYPFIQTGDVKAANLHIKEYSETYNEVGLAQSKLWDRGTLLITIAANIAETAILDIKACFPDSIVGFIPNESKVNVFFVKYYIDYIKREMQSISQGTTQDNLSLDKIRTFKLKIPEKRIVDEITNVLLSYDKLIENNNRRIAILEEMAQSLYREWFVKFRFPGHKNTKFIDSPLGKIPKGWEISIIGKRFRCSLGGTPSRKKPGYWDNGTIPWINSGAINQARIIEPSEYITELGFRKSAAKILPIRTTLVAITGATLGQVSLNEIETTANQSVVGIIDDRNICKEWLFQAINKQIQDMINKASGGAQQHINKGIVEETNILIPPEKVLLNYKEIIKLIFDQLRILFIKNINLKKQRDLLLSKLISGDVKL